VKHYLENLGKFWRGIGWLWTRRAKTIPVLHFGAGTQRRWQSTLEWVRPWVHENDFKPTAENSIEYREGWGPWRFLLVYILDYGTRVHTGGAVVSWSRWWWERRQKYGHANLLSRLLNHLDENHGARAGGALWGTEDTGWALVGGLVFWAGLLALVGWLLWRWLA